MQLLFSVKLNRSTIYPLCAGREEEAIMAWLLIGYMFLFIHRPFEFWPFLGDLHVERVYFLGVFLYWLVYPGKRWLTNNQHWAYVLFAGAVLVCWAMSPWMDHGQIVVENWFKIVLFYFLFVSVVHDEKTLKHLAWGFLLVMGIYMAHSFKEFLGGKHTFRMGIIRMVGIDSSLGDPNSFGASIVLALPFVTAFWNSNPSQSLRWALILYVCLSVGCVLLTGSRSSFLCLSIWGTITVMRSRHRWKAISAAIVVVPVIFMMLGESLQNRFQTIIDSDVGPENAKISGEGRIEGFLTGLNLFGANPLTGVGPGAWRPATGSTVESHNMVGQLVGELGGLGLICFSFILICFWQNLRWMKRKSKLFPGMENQFLFQLSKSIGMSLFIMLLAGIFGHNLFRHNWLWYGGFLIIARYCVTKQLRQAQASVVYSPSWRITYPQVVPA
jgi:O-antigen ligase